MTIQKNQVYKTPDGRILKVIIIRESGTHTLTTIDENGKVIPDKKNSFGHIVDRCNRFCSEETVKTFKLVK